MRTGIGISALSFLVNDDIDPLTIYEINNLNRNSINGFDRLATLNYSTTESRYSDILLATSILSHALLTLSDDIRKDFAPIVNM